MKRGTVSSRVALLLRSAEVKPLFERFVQLMLSFLFYSLPCMNFRAGLFELCHLFMHVRDVVEWREGLKALSALKLTSMAIGL
jgi:hypothetical protein